MLSKREVKRDRRYYRVAAKTFAEYRTPWGMKDMPRVPAGVPTLESSDG